MKADFSRLTFRAAKHFSLVLIQQGRVLLDADFNEQGAILANAIRQRMRDLLGPHAGRADAAGTLAFSLSSVDDKLAIAYGRYYVDGLAAENTAPLPDDKNQIAPLFYDGQPGYPFPNDIKTDDFTIGTPYFFFLDVSEQPVTRFEDPTIREVALGGPDSAVRMQVMWHVRAVERPAGAFKPEEWLDEHVQRHSRTEPAAVGARLPQMRAFTDPKDNPDDTPCVADPLGGYSGVENQLYRIEIHTDGSEAGVPLTFKWSRENGSVAAAWIDVEGNDLIVDGIRDTARGFSPGQWVEVTDQIAQLRATPGVMARLVKVERNRLTLDPASLSAPLPPRVQLLNPVVRRWDHRASKDYQLKGGAVVLEEDKVYNLERGIKVSFRKMPAAAPVTAYRTLDYWLVPARSATANIEWPFHIDDPAGSATKVYDYSEPVGVYHAYAPLAVVTPNAAADPTIDPLQRKIIQLWS